MDRVQSSRHPFRLLALPLLVGGCGQIGTPEILMILAAIVLLFGATRLPALGRALGETIRGFKQGLDKDGENKSLPAKQKKPLPEGNKESGNGDA